MARIKVEEVVDRLSSEFTRALADTFKKHAPDVDFNKAQAFRDFKRSVDRYCSTWERIPDQYVDKD